MKSGALTAGSIGIGGATFGDQKTTIKNVKKFKLNYAPHFGMFKNHAGENLIDQLQFMNDNGFTALEDNGMPGRSIKMQENIGRKLSDLKMEMGVFVAEANFNEPTFTSGDKKAQDKVLNKMKNAVEVAQRVNAKWTTVVPGTYDKKLAWDFQTSNCIDLLKRCCEILEPHGLIMVLEPLNWHTDHPGVFLTKIPQAYMICQAVNSPSCKILDDLYHQQITEGNLIPNMDQAWSEIAYIQVGDNPGRKEPGTGEINYNNIFRHLHKKQYKGIVGMEHGNSIEGKEGEKALISAYLEVDNF